MRKFFLLDFFQAFYSPQSLYQKISNGQKSSSWICVLIYCIIYIIGSLWLHFNDFKPFTDTWIKLPEEKYYLIQSLYIAPLVYLMWITGTGVIHVVCQFCGGKGRFEILFKMTGYSLWAPWYLLIIVDCIHSTPEWLYNIILCICIIGVLWGTTVATMIEEKVNLFKALFSSLLAFILTGIILFTYIR
jgi:hypothetical protein